MLNLDQRITLDADTIKASNLTDRFTESDLVKIGNWVSDGYKQDKQSRQKWETRCEAGMDLAMQIQKEKNFPWPGSSNVAFPLVTIAIMQFHSRAYPALISGPDIVKYEVTGSDPHGDEKGRAERVGMHMSWQLMKQDMTWQTQHNRLLINLATVGTTFKKSYYSGINHSDMVSAKDLVMDYYAKSVEDCPRKTHIIPLFRNDIYSRVKRGIFKDILEDTWYKAMPVVYQDPRKAESDNRSGMTPPMPDETTPFIFLEQHCSLDLDRDGYAEPYIITIEEKSHTTVRIVTRFDSEDAIDRVKTGEYKGDIISITALEYFTKYGLIPSPDGGIYDIGFGILLGPLNESTNALVNQLIDAGSMSNAAGGFLGRGAKIRGGVYTFAPFGWQRVDSTGDDLRKSIYPLPVREPSAVLFQLLSLLINYTNRVSGSTDIMVGESVGQNTAADTARLMAEQGAKIYNALFKNVWTSMQEEFRKLYILNAMYMPDQMTFGTEGKVVSRRDYLGDPTRISPVADPHTTSDMDRINQANMLKQAAMQTPGYDPEQVERRWLTALKIDNIDQIYPGPKKVPPGENIKITIEKMRLQGHDMQLKWEQQKFMGDLMEERRLNDAKIHELEAKAASLIASIGAERAAQEIEVFHGMIEMVKSRNDIIQSRLDIMKKGMELQNATSESVGEDANSPGMGGLAQPPMQSKVAGVGQSSDAGVEGQVGAGGL